MMAALPKPLHSLVSAIYGWWEQDGEKQSPRAHLGASQIGQDCERALWYSFRWDHGAQNKFEGRVLRLFNRGQREEEIIVRELRGIGAEVLECQPDGTQWNVKACGGHFGGSMDGVARKLPGGSAENWEVLEFKTHSEKSFKDVSDHGVAKSKPQHYDQMQTYMALTGMTRANYIAVNKNNDALYYERVHADADAGKRIMEKAERIVFAAEPLKGVSQSPTWYQCKQCDHYSLCHSLDVPVPTCRTCTHVTPTRDGQWLCERHQRTLNADEQLTGCDGHRFIPILLDKFAEYQDGDSVKNFARYKNKLTGASFVNGAGESEYTSTEIYSATDKRCLGASVIQEIKILGNARVVG